jgi:hypothetical protein
MSADNSTEPAETLAAVADTPIVLRSPFVPTAGVDSEVAR